jgi:hypothetical protein
MEQEVRNKPAFSGVYPIVHRINAAVTAIAVLLLSGCGHVFVLSRTQSRDEMLSRASHVLIGVIEYHKLESWPFFRVSLPSDVGEAKYWKVLRRRVRVETVLRGSEYRTAIDVYEVFWTGGTTGDWNSTPDGERALFLLRVEDGYYHLVQDWWRSIFPVTSGPHSRLPLDDSHPMWERIALMNWWMEDTADTAHNPYPHFRYNDPGSVLGLWRTVKIERGLVSYPNRDIRLLACGELTGLTGWGQDECWESLSEEDRAYQREKCRCDPAEDLARGRENLVKLDASWWWTRFASRDERRLLTTISNPKRRAELCRLYEHEYPGDHDNGCPADRPPPATIVTERGDLPLEGAWPR